MGNISPNSWCHYCGSIGHDSKYCIRFDRENVKNLRNLLEKPELNWITRRINFSLFKPKKIINPMILSRIKKQYLLIYMSQNTGIKIDLNQNYVKVRKTLHLLREFINSKLNSRKLPIWTSISYNNFLRHYEAAKQISKGVLNPLSKT